MRPAFGCRPGLLRTRVPAITPSHLKVGVPRTGACSRIAVAVDLVGAVVTAASLAITLIVIKSADRHSETDVAPKKGSRPKIRIKNDQQHCLLVLEYALLLCFWMDRCFLL